MENVKNNRKYYIFLFGIVLFYCLRFIFLDADAHSYLLNEIQPIDEVYYNEIGFKIADTGIGNIIGKGAGDVTIPNAKCYLISNVLTGISMTFLGKTYFALRLPNVLLGLIGLVLFIKTLDLLGINQKLKICSVIFYVVDFNLLTMTRSAITVVPCMVSAILYLYMYIRHRANCFKKVFWSSFISIFSFCSVYMGVSFFVLGNFLMTLYLIIQNRREKKNLKRILVGFVAGNIAGFFLSEILALTFLNEHIIKVVLGTFSGFSAKISESLNISTQLLHWCKTGSQFWTSFMFRYNFVFLLLFVVSVLCWWRKKKSEEFFLLFTFLFAHWLQTIVLENATASKATISYGVVLLFIVYTMNSFDVLKLSNVRIAVATLFSIGVWGLGIIFYRSFFSKRWMFFMIIYNLVCVFIGILLRKNKKRKVGLGVLLSIVLVNMLMATKVVFSSPTYDDKTICMELNDLVGDNRMIGGFPLPFSLYNNVEVGIGAYNRYTSHGMDFEYVNSLYKEEVESNEKLFFIGYASGNNAGAATMDEINTSLLKDTDYYFKPIRYFERHYYSRNQNDGDIILYELVLRNDK